MSWFDQENDINETLVLQIASAIVSSGLRDVGYEYVNLDAGVWSPNRTASGEMQPDPAKFPSGMKSLADKLHAMKLKLGVYINLGTDHATCGRLGAYGHYSQDAKTIVRACLLPQLSMSSYIGMLQASLSHFVSPKADKRVDMRHRPLSAQIS